MANSWPRPIGYENGVQTVDNSTAEWCSPDKQYCWTVTIEFEDVVTTSSSMEDTIGTSASALKMYKVVFENTEIVCDQLLDLQDPLCIQLGPFYCAQAIEDQLRKAEDSRNQGGGPPPSSGGSSSIGAVVGGVVAGGSCRAKYIEPYFRV
jgi:hypothetical protein